MEGAVLPELDISPGQWYHSRYIERGSRDRADHGSDLDLFLTTSGQEFSARDQEILDRYARIYGKEYCRTGCNDCEPGCPYGVLSFIV